MLLTALSFVTCGFKDFGFLWTMSWRFLSGSTGAICMVFAPPTVLAIVPERLRGVVSGVIFAGIGGGVIISATLIPALLQSGGPQAAWFGIAVCAFLLTGAAWAGWPRELKARETGEQKTFRAPSMVPVLLVTYGLFAAGLVPHMIFLNDYIETGLHRGVEAAGLCWLVYGIGATVVPPLVGRLCDQFGVVNVLHAVIVVNVGAVAMPLVGAAEAWLALSAFIVGGFTVTIAALILGRLHEMIPDRRQQYHFWGFATASFAAGHAASAYLNSYIFSQFGSFLMLFAVGAGLTALALAVDLTGFYRARAKP